MQCVSIYSFPVSAKYDAKSVTIQKSVLSNISYLAMYKESIKSLLFSCVHRE